MYFFQEYVYFDYNSIYIYTTKVIYLLSTFITLNSMQMLKKGKKGVYVIIMSHH